MQGLTSSRFGRLSEFTEPVANRACGTVSNALFNVVNQRDLDMSQRRLSLLRFP